MIDSYVIARVRDGAPEIYTVEILAFHETPFQRGNQSLSPGTRLKERLWRLGHAAAVASARITEVLRSGRQASVGEEIEILYQRDISIREVRMDGSLVYEDALIFGAAPNRVLRSGDVVAVYLDPDGNGCYRPVMAGHGLAANHDLWKRHIEDRELQELGPATAKEHSVPAEFRRLAELCKKAHPKCRIVITPKDEQTYIMDVSIPDPQELIHREVRAGEFRLDARSDDEFWKILDLLSFGKIKRPDPKA